MRRAAAAALLALALSGCESFRGTELPDEDPGGSDAMRLSPCVCAEVDYGSPGYRWRG